MKMSRINKQILNDYFGSFFKQYSLTKEQFTKLRNLVDNAECGCCEVVTIYWVDNEISATTPANQQIIFTDIDDNVVSQTSVDGTSPQRLCVPRTAVNLCLNVIDIVTTDGTITISGTDGFTAVEADAIDESCSTISFPFADSYIITSAEPE